MPLGADMREDAVSNYWRGFEDGVRQAVQQTMLMAMFPNVVSEQRLIERIANNNPAAVPVVRRAILGDET